MMANPEGRLRWKLDYPTDPLPDDVAEMMLRLTTHRSLGFGQEAADMLERQQQRIAALSAPLPDDVANQLYMLRRQCIWQRSQGTHLDNGYPYHKHFPDCDICRSAELIERLNALIEDLDAHEGAEGWSADLESNLKLWREGKL